MANTTNLDLVKPAGTDHALISVLNSNSDKIDAFAGTINSKISTKELTAGSLSSIESQIVTLVDTLSANEIVKVKFTLTSDSYPFEAMSYIGTVSKISSKYFVVNVQGAYATVFIQGAYRNGTWTWNDINAHLNTIADITNTVTQNQDTGSLHVYKWNKMVQVTLNANGFFWQTGETIIATGLPIPKGGLVQAYMELFAPLYDAGGTGTVNNNVWLGIKYDGKLHVLNNTGSQIGGSARVFALTYMCE